MQEFLRQNEEQLRQVIQNLPVMLDAFDNEGNIVMWNGECERVTGYRADEIVGNPGAIELLYPDPAYREHMLAEWAKRGNNYRDWEWDITCKNGQTKTIAWSNVSEQCPIPGWATWGIGVDVSERKQADASLERRTRDLALLNRASHVFLSTLELDQVLTVILEEVRHMLGVLACSAWLTDPKTGDLLCRQVTEPHGKLMRGWRLESGQGLAGWVAKYGRSQVVPDVRADMRHFKGVDLHTGLELRSILTVPLWARQQVIGVLQVVDTEVNRFNDSDVLLLESLAATAAVTIENARLYEQARQDAETKAALLHEVNHRVKNNLTTIISLLYTEEQRQASLADQPVYQVTLTDLINRVQGLATVHKLLSASEWAPLPLSELTRQVIRSSLQALPRYKRVSVKVASSPVRVTADQAHHLALIINELVTNTIRHALANRSAVRIAVKIMTREDQVQFQFKDDGPGYPPEVLSLERYGLGIELIQPLVYHSLGGQLKLRSDHGAVTIIQFKAKG